MTSATRTAWRPRWVLALLVAVLAVPVGLFTAGPASAATTSAAQTRVGASTSAATVLVGPSANITAGQRLGNSPGRPQMVVATGVAANTAETAASANAGLDAFELNMSKTVASHLGETGKSGALALPYGSSRLTIQTIMDAVEPVPDPGGVPGALRWDAPGVMNGSQGTWELVVDPDSNTILHYLFAGAK